MSLAALGWGECPHHGHQLHDSNMCVTCAREAGIDRRRSAYKTEATLEARRPGCRPLGRPIVYELTPLQARVVELRAQGLDAVRIGRHLVKPANQIRREIERASFKLGRNV